MVPLPHNLRQLKIGPFYNSKMSLNRSLICSWLKKLYDHGLLATWGPQALIQFSIILPNFGLTLSCYLFRFKVGDSIKCPSQAKPPPPYNVYPPSRVLCGICVQSIFCTLFWLVDLILLRYFNTEEEPIYKNDRRAFQRINIARSTQKPVGIRAHGQKSAKQDKTKHTLFC